MYHALYRLGFTLAPYLVELRSHQTSVLGSLLIETDISQQMSPVCAKMVCDFSVMQNYLNNTGILFTKSSFLTVNNYNSNFLIDDMKNCQMYFN